MPWNRAMKEFGVEEEKPADVLKSVHLEKGSLELMAV